MRTVYFVGTGISVDAGAPLTRDILPNMITNSKGLQPAHELSKIVEKLLKPNIELIESEQIDAESLLSALYNPIIAKNIIHDDKRMEIKRWQDELKWAIFWTIAKGINDNPNHSLYENFVKSINPNDSILTLNYDIILENAFRRTELLYNPGYEPPMDFTIQIPLFHFNNRKGPHLIKLHGSFNWLRCTVCSDKANQQISIYKDKKVAATQIFGIHHFGKLENCDVCGTPLTPIIIPPQLNKEELHTQQTFKILWDQGFTDIERAEKLVFIGCSLREADIDARNLLRFAIKKSKIKEIHVVTLSKDEITTKNYEEFFKGDKRVIFHYGGFVKYVNDHLQAQK